MVASAMVTAQFIAGKATRDALFFANYDVTVLPTMVITTAVVSILFAIGSSKAFSRMSPSVFVPLAFAVSAVLLIVEWVLLPIIPKTAASIVYLQISGIGPMLGSGFWLIVSERFDPRTAKQQFGPIAGAGTLGGLVGGLMSERVATQLDMASMLPILAVLGFGCAWAVRQLATTDRRAGRPLPVDIAPDLSKAMPRPGLRMLRDTPYLRNLAFLVLLGTTGAALIDYVFKASAVSRLGPGEPLLRFFAIYYAAISLLTFLVQVTFSRAVLQRFGLGVSAATPAIALFTGGLGALVFPGLSSAIAARGGESVFRGSLFRASYEIFYTPIPRREKRAAKSLVDVAFDRLGDAVGGGLLRLSLLLAPQSRITTILVLAIGTAATAIFVATRLNRGYVLTLERSLLNRAAELDLEELDDPMTQTMMLQTSSIRLPPIRRVTSTADATAAGTRSQTTEGSQDLDHDLSLIRALRSRNREVITEALHSSDALPSTTIQDVIPLLAWDAVAEDVGIALRRIAEDHVGQLIDTLLDQNQDFAVRRRLARVFHGLRIAAGGRWTDARTRGSALRGTVSVRALAGVDHREESAGARRSRRHLRNGPA
jgi:hypothetical protein